MLSSTKPVCPHCHASLLRESKWESRAEKHDNPTLKPFRCLGCSYRFLAPRPRQIHWVALLIGSAGALTLLLFTLLFSLIKPAANTDSTTAPLDSFTTLASDTLQAAESGHPEAQFRVGKKLLMEAAIDAQKAPAALDWLTRAAENGHTGAMIQLGRMFRSGVGALQNYDIAAEWIQRAASAKDPEGMLELGRFYRDGVGVDKDLISAYVWMNRAAAAHYLEAARERESMARSLQPEMIKQAQRLSLEPVEASDQFVRRNDSAATRE